MASVSSYNEKSWRISFFDASKSPKQKVFYFKKKSFYKDFGLTKKQAEKTDWEMEHKYRTGEVDLWEKQASTATDLKISDIKLPIKGKDVIATLKDGSEKTVFRCACKNEKCSEWRCAITGFALMIDVV